MAAAEQQGERVVAVGRFGISRGTEQFGLRGCHRDQFLAGPPRLLAADLVHQPARGDRDQPATRVLRPPVGRPLQRGSEQGLLAGVLTQVELPVPAHQRGEDLRRQCPQQILDATGIASHRTSRVETPAFRPWRKRVWRASHSFTVMAVIL